MTGRTNGCRGLRENMTGFYDWEHPAEIDVSSNHIGALEVYQELLTICSSSVLRRFWGNIACYSPKAWSNRSRTLHFQGQKAKPGSSGSRDYARNSGTMVLTQLNRRLPRILRGRISCGTQWMHLHKRLSEPSRAIAYEHEIYPNLQPHELNLLSMLLKISCVLRKLWICSNNQVLTFPSTTLTIKRSQLHNVP